MGRKKKTEDKPVFEAQIEETIGEEPAGEIEVEGDKVDEMLDKGYKYLRKYKKPFEKTPRQHYWVYVFKKGKQ